MKRSVLVILLLSFLFCVTQSANSFAAVILYFDVDVTGQVSQLGSGNWLYQYTVSPVIIPGQQLKDMSHWWIELPPEKIETLSDFYLASVETNFNEAEPVPGVFTTLGNPITGEHYGVKWNSNQFITYSFISTHGPVLDETGAIDMNAYTWFAKDGRAYFDYGVIPGPNGHTEVPEPASVSLLAIGIFGLLGRGLKRRRV